MRKTEYSLPYIYDTFETIADVPLVPTFSPYMHSNFHTLPFS